jgi:sigma-B regulation protein RsbU (phosphoserine phosphatase)
MKCILMVDDEPDLEPLMSQHFRKQIKSNEYKLIFAHSGTEAIEKIKQNLDIEMIITDINMPGMDGFMLLEKIAELNRNLHTIVVSAYGDMRNIRMAMNRGAFDFVTKPVNFSDLENSMQRAIAHLEVLRKANDAQHKLVAVNQELKVATNIQQSILPKEFPNTPEIQVFGSMAAAAEVGGDFFDFFWLDEHHLGLVVGDVSGKGITGAFFMAIVRTHLKGIAPYFNNTSECLTRLNKELAKDNDAFMFVTLFYGIIDVRTGVIKYSNAGHCYPVIVRTDGTTEFLKTKLSMAIGIDDTGLFTEEEMTLKKGETFFLYTDGVNEAFNESFEEFGNQRLLDSLKDTQTLNAQDLTQKLIDNIHQFIGNAPQSDDLTCLGTRFYGVGA